MNVNPHEEEFARAFITPKKRDRYLSLLASGRGREKLVRGLNHCQDLDPRFATELPANQQSALSIEKILKQKGAPEICHVMSDIPEIDNRELSLSEALLKTVGSDAGTLLSCIPGKLAYFEMEGFDGRYILER